VVKFIKSSGQLAHLDKPANKLLFAGSVGLFTSLFMIAFQPFGVSNYDPDFKINAQFIAIMLFLGAVVFVILSFNEFFLRPLLFRRMRFGLLIGWLAWVYVLTGSVLFFFYNLLGNWHDWHWNSYFSFLFNVAMVISFPIAGFLFLLRHQALQTEYIRLRSAPRSPRDHLLSFTSENGKDQLLVPMDQVLYLESEDNYVKVVYLEEGTPRSHLIRSTLKRVEEHLGDAAMIRCHRSFIVNLERVANCRGNRKALRLKLRGMEGIVPVSAKYTDRVLNFLEASSEPDG